jgi:hypothetical protein
LCACVNGAGIVTRGTGNRLSLSGSHLRHPIPLNATACYLVRIIALAHKGGDRIDGGDAATPVIFTLQP